MFKRWKNERQMLKFMILVIGKTEWLLPEEQNEMIGFLDKILENESKNIEIQNKNIIKRINHKGEWCDKINRTCQEGYCDQCEPFINKENYKRDEQ